MRFRLATLTVIVTSFALCMAAAPPQVDGERLPRGAVARMGTLNYRHGGDVTFVSCLPEGKLLTVGLDRTARLWDLSRHKEVRRFALPAPTTAKGKASSLSAAGLPVVAVSADGSVLASPDGKGVRLWELKTGKEREPIKELSSAVQGLALSPDGKLLAVTTSDGEVATWNLARSEKVRVLNPPLKEDLEDRPMFASSRASQGRDEQARFSPDGKRLAAFAADGGSRSIKVWDVATGKELTRVKLTRQSPTSSPFVTTTVAGYNFAFSPDGKLFAWSGPSGSIHLEDAATGKPRRYVKGEPGCRFVFAPDGKTLLALAPDSVQVQRWEVETGDEKTPLEWPAPVSSPVRETGRTPASSSFASALARAQRTTPFAISPDGKLLVGADGFGAVLVDTTTGKTLHGDGGQHRGGVEGLRFSADGKSVTSFGTDRTLRSWDAATGQQKASVPLPDGQRHALSPDGKYLACTATTAGAVTLADAATGKVLRTVKPEAEKKDDEKGKGVGRKTSSARASRGTASPFAFTTGGLAVRHGTGVRLYDPDTGKEIRSYALGSSNVREKGAWASSSLAQAPIFLPGGKLMIKASEARLSERLEVRRSATGELLCHIALEAGQRFEDAAASPDGRTVAVDTGDGQITLYETATGKERGRVGKKAEVDDDDRFFRTVQSDISGRLLWSPDASLLVQADGARVRLWDVAAGTQLGTFDGHLSQITALAFSRTGYRLATGSADGQIMVWDVATLVKGRKARPALKAEQVREHWVALGGEDAAKAFRAVNDLSAAPAEALALLKKELKPVRLDLAQVTKWVRALDSDDFDEREQATASLRALGSVALPALKKALADEGTALEARRRLKTLVEGSEGKTQSVEDLRAVRGVEVLERLATPQARKLLEELASGVAEVPLTEAAKKALEHLGR